MTFSDTYTVSYWLDQTENPYVARLNIREVLFSG